MDLVDGNRLAGVPRIEKDNKLEINCLTDFHFYYRPQKAQTESIGRHQKQNTYDLYNS